MFKVETYGPWKQAIKMLGGYYDRIEYLQKIVGFELASKLLESIKKNAPHGEEYSDYFDSLEVIELTGEKGAISFGIISKDIKTSVSSLKNSSAADRTVVYITPSGTGENSGVSFLAKINPWPVNLLPNGLKNENVVLVHRLVSMDEAAFVRDQVVGFIRTNDFALRSFGYSWNIDVSDEESVKNLSSMPDYMWMALRAEFGINESARPHWRPAIRKTMSFLKEIVNSNKEIKLILQDTLYRKHTLSNDRGLEQMDVVEFDKKVGKFEEALI